ncbi:MAG: hypothetical protein PHT07_24690 [Paludibacter sp.]|jgi:hypothetical protein|nr:hypothetical protein [Paludibacter sp.]
MDYTEAKKELEKIYSGLNLSFEVLSIEGKVKDGWQHIHFDCVFKNQNGCELRCDYSMGLGLFSMKNVPMHIFNHDETIMYEAILLNPHSNFRDKKLFMSVIEKIAIKTKQIPNAYEVLGGLCRDGYDAHENSFEDYCANYGMNPDSIKDKKVYDTCLDYYFKVERLIGHDLIYTFYELMNEL